MLDNAIHAKERMEKTVTLMPFQQKTVDKVIYFLKVNSKAW